MSEGDGTSYDRQVGSIVAEIEERTSTYGLDPAHERFHIIGSLGDPLELLLEYSDPQTSCPFVRTYWHPALEDIGGSWILLRGGLAEAVQVAKSSGHDPADAIVSLRQRLERNVRDELDGVT